MNLPDSLPFCLGIVVISLLCLPDISPGTFVEIEVLRRRAGKATHSFLIFLGLWTPQSLEP